MGQAHLAILRLYWRLAAFHPPFVPMDTQSERTATVSTWNVQDLGRLIKKPGTKSKIWANFKVYEKDHTRAHCCLANCKSPDFKISGGSTGHLQGHLTAHHREVVKEYTETAVRQFHDQRISNDSTNESGSKRTLDGYVSLHHAPNFLTYAVMWIAMTYQHTSKNWERDAAPAPAPNFFDGRHPY